MPEEVREQEPESLERRKPFFFMERIRRGETIWLSSASVQLPEKTAFRSLSSSDTRKDLL